jgi:hypothetical protein
MTRRGLHGTFRTLRTFRTFCTLSWPDRRLLIGAWCVQFLTALALRMMPLAALRARAARLRPIARLIGDGSEARVIWAIEASGRRLRSLSTCLVRALAAELMLSSPERPLCLSIGVRRATSGALEAHAWVARDNRVLVGGMASDTYEPLVAWDSLST